MIPKQHTGRGFKGASEYLLHDKRARTSERVAWTHMDNLSATHAARAWKEMARTQGRAERLKQAAGVKQTGRKGQTPVYHLSLSWAQDERPDKAQMLAAGREALKAVGLAGHQALFVCHSDEPHPHVHILVNRVHAETGKMATLSRSKRKLSAWALDYEKRQGKIRCEQRAENARALAHGDKPRDKDSVIRRAWERSDSGKGFQQALAAEGYVLAQGNKRVVVVTPQGKAINPTRVLPGVKAADVTARLAGLDGPALPRVEDVRGWQKNAEKQAAARKEREEHKRADQMPGKASDSGKEKAAGGGERFDREGYNAAWEQGIIDAAIAQENARGAARKDRDGKRQSQGSGGSSARPRDSARGHFPKEPAAARSVNDNDRRGALESRQFHERLELEDRLSIRRAREVGTLDQVYDVRAERQAIEEMEGKLIRTARDRARIEALRKTIANAQWRREEYVKGLARKDEEDRQALARRHAQEREALEQALAVRGARPHSNEKEGQEAARLGRSASRQRAQLQARHWEQRAALERSHNEGRGLLRDARGEANVTEAQQEGFERQCEREQRRLETQQEVERHDLEQRLRDAWSQSQTRETKPTSGVDRDVPAQRHDQTRDRGRSR